MDACYAITLIRAARHMETSNYELGYADFGTRAEWPHPAVIGHGTYFAQQAKYHSRGDYFENAIMLIGSGSSTNCTLSASPGFCPTPTAWPTVEFDQIENEVTRGRSTMYEDESFLMPGGLESLYPNASGQVGTNAVLGSLTLANPQLLSNQAPLMSLCFNATGHTLNVGDVVSLQANGGGTNYNNCIDPTTYDAGGGQGTPAEYPCFIVTAPSSSTVTSFPSGQPVSIAMPGSQVPVTVYPSNGGASPGFSAGAVLVAQAPGGSPSMISGSVIGYNPSSSTNVKPQTVAQACAYALTSGGNQTGPTQIKAIARW
jgi:hypothetical protein